MAARRALGTHTMEAGEVAEHEMLYEWHTSGGTPCHYDKSKASQHRCAPSVVVRHAAVKDVVSARQSTTGARESAGQRRVDAGEPTARGVGRR